MITEQQRANLTKLANYLADLQPTPLRQFHMQYYLVDDLSEDIDPKHTGNIPPECGTVGCAIGHGPFAGIPFAPGDWDWAEYTQRAFGLDALEPRTYPAWAWMFGSTWARIDNTPQGAAKRIRHFLEHGAPTDFEDQILGEAPYIFAGDLT